jgi:hypothetical protein
MERQNSILIHLAINICPISSGPIFCSDRDAQVTIEFVEETHNLSELVCFTET